MYHCSSDPNGAPASADLLSNLREGCVGAVAIVVVRGNQDVEWGFDVEALQNIKRSTRCRLMARRIPVRIYSLNVLADVRSRSDAWYQDVKNMPIENQAIDNIPP